MKRTFGKQPPVGANDDAPLHAARTIRTMSRFMETPWSDRQYQMGHPAPGGSSAAL